MMMKKHILPAMLPLLVAGILVFSSCIYPYRAEDTRTRTRAATDVNAITVTSHNGAITARTSTDTTVTVKITRYAYGRSSADARQRLERVTLTDTLIEKNWCLTVQTPPVTQPLGALFDISAPAAVRLDLNTSNGRVTVSGFSNDFSVTTSNADVSCTGTTGTALVNTSNGKIVVSVHAGSITARTTNAAIECDLSFLPATGAVSLETSNGKVTLLLPPDVSATIDAATSNGTVAIAGYPGVEYLEQRQNHIRARLGSGAASININTTNGDIVIKSRM